MSESLATNCGNCMRKLRIPMQYEGKRIACPRCKVRLAVPTAAEVEAALPERYVCNYVVGEEEFPDGAHPADPTGGSDDPLNDSLIIRGLDLMSESSAELPAVTDVPGEQGPDDLLDDLIGIPDIDMTTESSAELPTMGYELVKPNTIVIHDASQPFMKQLGAMVRTLPASLKQPIRIDLRAQQELKLRTVRRVIAALLAGQLDGKPTELLVTPAQRTLFSSTPIAKLIQLGSG